MKNLLALVVALLLATPAAAQFTNTQPIDLPTTAIQGAPQVGQWLYILFIQKENNKKQNEPGKFGYYNTLKDCLAGASELDSKYEDEMVKRGEKHITEDTWMKVECHLGVWMK